MDDSLEEIKLAARRLATTEADVVTFRQMDDVLSAFPHLQLRFVGDKAWINPLMRMFTADPERYKVTVQFTDDVRKRKGLTSLFRDTSKFEKNPYQADLMVVVRERLRRAVDVENMARSERDALKGVQRKLFEKEISKRWAARRQTMLKAERDRKGGSLTKPEMQEALKTFWATIDAELEAAERGGRK